MPTTSQSYAVIGAGASGLAVARDLALMVDFPYKPEKTTRQAFEAWRIRG